MISLLIWVALMSDPLQKPGGFEDVMNHFATQSSISDVQPRDLACIGDRYMTDIAFGNLHGMHTIYVSPITLEGEKRATLQVSLLPLCLFSSRSDLDLI